MKLKFLGTGTSQGVPVIACHCEVCVSLNPKDKRFRSSALVTTDCGKKILIDCGPDFRMQMLENKEEQIEFIKDNYPATTHHISKRRVRHNFFSSIKTELQAYLLGFYTADGSIDEKRKTLRVELQKGDSEIVYLFKDSISEDARLY